MTNRPCGSVSAVGEVANGSPAAHLSVKRRHPPDHILGRVFAEVERLECRFGHVRGPNGPDRTGLQVGTGPAPTITRIPPVLHRSIAIRHTVPESGRVVDEVEFARGRRIATGQLAEQHAVWCELRLQRPPSDRG
jgi:hypothetical protein